GGWGGQQPAQRANPIAQTQLASAGWQEPQAQQPQAQAWQQPQQPAWQQPPPPQQTTQASQQPPQWQQPAPQAAPAPAAPGNALRVEAELGAHSSTNFYKGLSGNDVVDSGGIFIATYAIPEIGRPVSIKVSLPGGYEF